MYKNILVHYPNGFDYNWTVYEDSRLFKLSSRWDCNTGVYDQGKYGGMKMDIKGGYFEVTEISEDKTEAWLEYFP